MLQEADAAAEEDGEVPVRAQAALDKAGGGAGGAQGDQTVEGFDRDGQQPVFHDLRVRRGLVELIALTGFEYQ